jgi:nitrogen fixation-related uncharacterized protein
MPVLAALILLMVILALLAMAALAWGVDSRDDSVDPRAPERGIVA